MGRKKRLPPKLSTRIGEFEIPLSIKGGQRIVQFKDGYYAFWTAVFKRRVDKRWRVWGRAKVGLSAGDRFDRMKRESRAAYIPKDDRGWYARMWEMMQGGKNIKVVRPTTKKELARWMKEHPVQRAQRV